ncbi:50S ribosomal protein L24 [Blattabacterium cuenoti]|uniref:50S ribosomal protein L24 n=1 Tax=Blattabacterium cuenoti TaxID=1653831 RepID=UPI00163C3896|nr:50S ribosomal protein L24 [Blattabacterium cuenoti]
MIKKGDLVSILSGNYKGNQGVVLKVIVKKKKAIIQGINMIKKHIKPSSKQTKGGIIEKEAPIHITNLKKLSNNIKKV